MFSFSKVLLIVLGLVSKSQSYFFKIRLWDAKMYGFKAKNKTIPSWKKPYVKPDFHSRISLVAGNIFVGENYKKQVEPQISLLVSKIVVSGGHLSKQLLSNGFWGKTSDVWRFFVGEHFVSNKRNAWDGNLALTKHFGLYFSSDSEILLQLQSDLNVAVLTNTKVGNVHLIGIPQKPIPLGHTSILTVCEEICIFPVIFPGSAPPWWSGGKSLWDNVVAKAFLFWNNWNKNRYHGTVSCSVFSSRLAAIWAIT